ncbi:hypothetical protein CAP35_06930 [Chitinophagaceae bacterium IBVUCB1]|nr:hypothetical protein CAP35_06930 [Chitinophagaceae bacterium IBVUCB1]
MFIKQGLLCFFLLIHLQTIAGELIKIENVATMHPTITVSITDEKAKMLAVDVTMASNILSLYMIINDTPASVPVSGSYLLKDSELSFSPRYTLGNSTVFEIQYQGGGEIMTKRFTTPSKPNPNALATVVTTYPLSDTIPYNTLFFHVRFSESMLDDKYAYKHVKVYDENGVERERPWRQKSFWLDSNKLLVLMIHPGRVKTGIHYESPLFDSGKHYTIKIEQEIKDKNVQKLRAEYTRQYFVNGEDRICPKVEMVHKVLPHAQTKEPIILSFSESMDHASVTEGTMIYDGAGKPMPCIVRATANDSDYQVIPIQNWRKGRYTFVLKSSVYDVAANRIRRPFETTNIKEMETDKLNTTFTFRIK